MLRQLLRRAAVVYSFLLILGLQISQSPSLAQEHKTLSLPFRSVSGLILLDIKVNGKPAVVLLDTGANVTVLRMAT